MSTRFIALLRGINVGGNKKVPMAELTKALEKAGFTSVKTLLASGNVLFDTTEKNEEKLTKTIEEVIEKHFGFTSSVIVRTAAEIQTLVKADPFKGIPVTKDTRLYVSFRKEPSQSSLKIPYVSSGGQFRILRVTPTEICSVLTVDGSADTVKLMGILEKEFGKTITTRNWNTVVKMAAT